MKKLLSFMVIMLFSLTAVTYAQSDSVVVSVPEVDNVAKATKGKFQYGATIRYGSPYPYSHEEALVFAGGYRFNRRNYLGLNIGVSHSSVYKSAKGIDAEYIGCPISLDYIHYFPVGKAKKHSVYLGAELGTVHSFGQTYTYPVYNYNYETEEWDDVTYKEEGDLSAGIAVIKVGMDHPIYKHMHLNWGIRFGLLALGVGLGVSF